MCAALGVAGILGAAAQTPTGGQQPAGGAQARPQPLTTSKFVSHDVVAGCTKAGSFANTPEYTVTCSYRTGPGVVEIHPKETDVIYVLDGAATFVTGGTAQNVKATDPLQPRGTDIQGGEPHHLVKGDVIVVPAGQPHWFKEVPKSISYHVVKLTTPAGGAGTDVTYVDRDKVAAALNSKGEIFSAPKLRLSGGYRTGPDQPANYGANPEVHPTSIDIFYCIDGAVTVVTGGKVVSTKESGENPMAGAKVEQGRADHMTKGDWLLVPSGTPHWHTEYPKPFGFYRYLLVKVQE
jgi:quercetin dioxygenase-like cupin family protein